MNRTLITLLLLLLGHLLAAVEIELQLVVHDQPDVTVDQRERSRPILAPVTTEEGVRFEQTGVDYSGWARNILIDGQPAFERYHEGKYIDRLPRAKLDLDPGEHTLWPGDHTFTISPEGTVTTDAPELIVEGRLVKLKAYPVTVRAFWANPPDGDDVPMAMRTAPLPNLTVREAEEALAGKKRDLLPEFLRFAPLTLWLPANATGRGYLLHPVGATFHVTPEGVVPGAGEGQAVDGLRTAGHRIEIPLFGYPVQVDEGVGGHIQGVQQLKSFRGGTVQTRLYPRFAPFEFAIAEGLPPVTLAPDPRQLPVKRFTIQVGEEVFQSPRALTVELESRHLQPGQTLTGRLFALDARVAAARNRRFAQASSELQQARKQAQALTDELKAARQAAEKAAQVVGKPTAEPPADPAEREKAEAAAQALRDAKAQVVKLEEQVATAQAAVLPAQDRVTQLKSRQDEPAANPLADANRLVQLREVDQRGPWRDLAFTLGDDGAIAIEIPADVPTGVYLLRLGVTDLNRPLQPLVLEQPVTIAKPVRAAVGIFTNRGRDAFFRGERFWLAIGVNAFDAPLPAGTPIAADLVDPRGQRLPLWRGELPEEVRDRATQILTIQPAASLNLAPGRYTVEATVGGFAARPLTIDLVETEPATHFTNLKNAKYSAYNKLEQRLYDGEMELAKPIVQGLVDYGFNAFMGMNYQLDRVVKAGREIEGLARERPQLGPWEQYYRPTGRDALMNECVRHNIRFWENCFTYNDSTMPRGDKILNPSARYVALEAASMQYSPAFQGLCFYDELYAIGGQDPHALINYGHQAEELLYRAKHPDLTSARATRALDRFARRPPAQRQYQDLANYRTWPAYQEYSWTRFLERMVASARQVMPGSRNFNFMRVGGGPGRCLVTLGPASAPAFYHDTGLDIAVPVMYKDGGYGARPQTPAIMADALRVDPDVTIWTQLEAHHTIGLHGAHVVRNAFWALSQDVEGFSFFEFRDDPVERQPEDYFDRTTDITNRLTVPYGDFLLTLDRGYGRVAIYYSRQSEYLAGRKSKSVRGACESLWMACQRSGFPADFLYDHQILAGQGQDYDVIFVPGVELEKELSPEVEAALRRLIQAGKTIIAEQNTKLPFEEVVKLPVPLDEYEHRQDSPFPRNLDFETSTVWDMCDETTAAVAKVLPKFVEPAAQHQALLGPDWLQRGQGHYLVVTNFNWTGFTGLHKALYQAPQTVDLRFPARQPVCYDILEMKRVQAPADGEDWQRLTADLRHYPGKVYAFLPAEIAGVRLGLSEQVVAGNDLAYRVAITDADGNPIDAAFPVELTLKSPDGHELLHVHRAAAPELAALYRLPVNAAPGTYTLEAREWISGQRRRATFTVTAPPDAPAQLAAAPESPVLLYHPEEVRTFLAQQADVPFRIVVDPGQEWLRPEAERLRAALVERGQQAEIVGPEAIRLPADWNRENPVLDEARLWRGHVVEPGLFIDAPAILLGRRFDNRLVEALALRDVLPDAFTRNFPGPGRALVAWLHQALSTQHDTVLILADDTAGLRQGIDAFLDPTAQPATPAHPPIAHPPSPTEPARVAFRGQALPRAPVSYRQRQSLEDEVRALDVDPATGRVLVGTHGYGHNLFCLDRQGKLLWKQFLPEHHVYTARWYDDGKRVVAATGMGWFVFFIDGQDGRVLSRVPATEWPTMHYGEGMKDTHTPITVNRPARQILITGATAVVAVDYEGQVQWVRDRAEAITELDVDAVTDAAPGFPRYRFLRQSVPSPDGSEIVQTEMVRAGSTVINREIQPVYRFVAFLLDATTGEVRATNEEDPGAQTRPGGWHVTWPPGAERPLVETEGKRAPLLANGSFGTFEAVSGSAWADGSQLVAHPELTARLGADGSVLWEQPAPDRPWIADDVTANAERTRLYRQTRAGRVSCLDAATGKLLWEADLGRWGRLHPVGDELVAGTHHGRVVWLDAQGQRTATANLLTLHEAPEMPYAHYLYQARMRDPDAGAQVFAAGRDRPGDYDEILRFGLHQLANRHFADDSAWQQDGGPITRVAGGPPQNSDTHCLALQPGHLVSQSVSHKVIPAATYLLEYHFRVDDLATRVTAGALEVDVEGHESFTGTTLPGRPGQWTFARLAIKTTVKADQLTVGFETEGGPARIDAVSLRPIRFPSANLVANDELHAIIPTYVEDIRVQYERIPATLERKLMNQNRVTAGIQGGTSVAGRFWQEQAFLHNGRLDDVGQRWRHPPTPFFFTVALQRPAWISHLVLYLSNAKPEDAYRTLVITANDLETKLPHKVGMVRHNRRRFVVVHFPEPIHTDSLRIMQGPHTAHHEVMTEIEVYGPLGGPDMAAQRGFPADPHAYPMFMGGPRHVPAKFPADLTGTYEDMGVKGRLRSLPVLGLQSTAANDLLIYAHAYGAYRSVRIPAPDAKEQRLEAGPSWDLGSISPTTPPALYSGRLLAGTAEGRMHAVANNGTYLWNFRADGRIHSAPLPDGDEVYFGSEDGKLYKVDVDSGILIWEYPTNGPIRGAPALAENRLYIASGDGRLHAVQADTGRPLWQAPIAPDSVASPAIHQGAVYVGDEDGRLHAFDAVTGEQRWHHDLPGLLSRCPVVTPAGVFTGTDRGHLAFLGFDGKLRWQRQLETRLSGQPVATESQLLLPTEAGLLVLRQADGEPDTRFQPPADVSRPLASVLPYGDKLLLTGAWTSNYDNGIGQTFTNYHSQPMVWRPAAVQEPEETP